ncbi:MAG: sigma-54-dependent Fis family transcriptional regulator [Bacteroidetes bacterium]|nr:sigma-54-dependent Fis family transcriptional regulator [Bacteroidota bacterium]
MNALRVLILDDERKIADKVSTYLMKQGYNAQSAYFPTQAIKILNRDPIDILISDVLMPEMNGLDLLKKIKSLYPHVEVIMITGHGDMDMVIKAMHLGAVDFIKKPFSFLDIQLAIERTGKFLRLQNQLQLVENRSSLISRDLENRIEKNLIGTSKKIKRVLETALKAGQDRDVSILITGENGTGKEIIARIIHHASERNKDVFFPVNSSAIPDSLIESEFFGHRKGSFTDAKEDKKGIFELANGGSLFLDEIADMPFGLQAKLLRALEEKKIKRVGSNKEIDVDIRLISATNQDIDQLIEEKKFRLDLLHRINTVTIAIPPLRERLEDIESLLNYFVEYFAKRKNKPIPVIEPDVLDHLKSYYFPGNVRELRNMIERAFILSGNDQLTVSDFPITNKNVLPENNESPGLNIFENELYLIREAMKKTNFNQKKAAVLLGISRDALIRRIKKYNIKINKNFQNE